MAKEDATTARRRKASILLGALMHTPERGLEAFREHRANPTLDILDVRRARDILEAINRILVEGGETSSARLEHAWRLLVEGKPPVDPVGIEPPVPPPAASTVAAPTSPAPVPMPAVAPPPPPLVRASVVAPSVLGLETTIDSSETVPTLVDSGAAMPFRAGGAVPPASLAAEVAAEASKLVGETGHDTPFVPDDAAPSLPFLRAERPGAVNATLPAAGAPAFDPPALTLQQYASLRAELAVQPVARAPVLARYGILDEAQFVELDRRWTARFMEDPEVYGAFRLAHEQFLAWLASKPKG